MPYPALANHLWQSTLCAAAAWLLTLALRKNRAAVRYGLWLAASVKFLIPFSLLVSAGSQLGWRTAPAIGQPQFSLVMEELGRPFELPAAKHKPAVAQPASALVPAVLLGVWLGGLTIGVVSWLRSWRRMRAVQRSATLLHLNLPIQAMCSPARLEPGVFGIRRPVLLLPEGITDRLTPLELEAVVTHELCHVRRRDNLTAAIHMVVESVFWFHPLVWWIEGRLVEERERACDEDVLGLGRDPQVYAESILKTCRLYLESRWACVAGVTGSDLRQRIEAIMAQRIGRSLDRGRKLLLASLGIATVAGPIAIGVLNAPGIRAQIQLTDTDRPRFTEASIKPGTPGDGTRIAPGPGSFANRYITLKQLIGVAYRVQEFQVTGGPSWVDSEHFDVVAQAEGEARGPRLLQMLQTLLEEMFKLVFHHETKELPIYELRVAGNGPGLRSADDRICPANPAPPPPSGPDQPLIAPCGGSAERPGELAVQKGAMSLIVHHLSHATGRLVVDKTGLSGRFDVTLKWMPDETRFRSMPYVDPNGPPIVTAVQEQLGLQLEAAKGPVEILVIDRAVRPQ
jgi:bla regulator protein BlaR1